MIRKFWLASIFTLGISVTALADVTMPVVHDEVGNPIGARPVVPVDASGNVIGAGLSSGQLPATLGQKTKAASLAVTLASDEDILSRLPSTLGVKTSANSLSVVRASDDTLPAGTNLLGKVGIDQTTPGTTNLVSIGTNGTVSATQSGTWTVQPGNTANTTAWKVDGSAVTQPVSGTVSANLNAGTNLLGKVGIDQTTPGTTNLVSIGTNGSVTATGNVADAAADSGNPLKISGIYESTLPTYTTGQRGNAHIGTRGALHVQIMSADSATGVATLPDNGDATAAAAGFSRLAVVDRVTVFNGATWDRAFTCTSQISATITAAATTQLVALSGATNIRVCAYQVGIATTGTYKFVSGTGSNCGTGTADITPATTLTAGNVVTMSGPSGGAIFRAGASNALCLAAVTGNVQVFVSYAQF